MTLLKGCHILKSSIIYSNPCKAATTITTTIWLVNRNTFEKRYIWFKGTENYCLENTKLFC